MKLEITIKMTLLITVLAANAVICAWGQSSSDQKLDRSGQTRVGKASFYAKSFSGKTMADGTLMRPQGNNAASKTLPLGTKALVTNLQTGKRAVVTVRDRGPYVKGRIVDLSPATAQKIGITPHEGVAKVTVTPLEVPQTDGTVKLRNLDMQDKNSEERTARLNDYKIKKP